MHRQSPHYDSKVRIKASHEGRLPLLRERPMITPGIILRHSSEVQRKSAIQNVLDPRGRDSNVGDPPDRNLTHGGLMRCHVSRLAFLLLGVLPLARPQYSLAQPIPPDSLRRVGEEVLQAHVQKFGV